MKTIKEKENLLSRAYKSTYYGELRFADLASGDIMVSTDYYTFVMDNLVFKYADFTDLVEYILHDKPIRFSIDELLLIGADFSDIIKMQKMQIVE